MEWSERPECKVVLDVMCWKLRGFFRCSLYRGWTWAKVPAVPHKTETNDGCSLLFLRSMTQQIVFWAHPWFICFWFFGFQLRGHFRKSDFQGSEVGCFVVEQEVRGAGDLHNHLQLRSGTSKRVCSSNRETSQSHSLQEGK